VHDLDGHELGEPLCYDVTVAVCGVGFETEKTDALSAAYDFREIGERGLRLGRSHVSEKDRAHFRVLARARRSATVGRGAERSQVEIANANVFDTGRELRLGKPRAARAGDGADVDEQLDSGVLERAPETIGRGTLISDRRE
jgi:hypothetical protein